MFLQSTTPDFRLIYLHGQISKNNYGRGRLGYTTSDCNLGKHSFCLWIIFIPSPKKFSPQIENWQSRLLFLLRWHFFFNCRKLFLVAWSGAAQSFACLRRSNNHQCGLLAGLQSNNLEVYSPILLCRLASIKASLHAAEEWWVICLQTLQIFDTAGQNHKQIEFQWKETFWMKGRHLAIKSPGQYWPQFFLIRVMGWVSRSFPCLLLFLMGWFSSHSFLSFTQLTRREEQAGGWKKNWNK